LSDAVNKALQYWVSHVDDTHYLLGSALGPDPFPTIVRDFQSVIGKEIKSQILKKEGRPISAGLDYPGIGPEHSYYHDIGRVTFENASDTQAMNALINFTKHEGIIPAIESAHALSYVERLAPTMSKEDIIVVTISGRGDKDMETIRQYMAERGLAND
ncbi:TPA: tryptophan synthase subunit beta, partial [Staphylococcus aureus]|nr:tryptophan synthase subunit beta [Staphylococcus aureus]